MLAIATVKSPKESANIVAGLLKTRNAAFPRRVGARNLVLSRRFLPRRRKYELVEHEEIRYCI